MTKEEILAAAGFPNTPEGIAAFYEAYPNPGDWQQQMAYGGMPNIMGIPFGAGITLANGGTPYYGGPLYPAQYGKQFNTNTLAYTGDAPTEEALLNANLKPVFGNGQQENLAGDTRFTKKIDTIVDPFSPYGKQSKGRFASNPNSFMNTGISGTNTSMNTSSVTDQQVDTKVRSKIYPTIQKGGVNWPKFKTPTEYDNFIARDPNLSLYSSEDLEGLGLVKPEGPNLKAIAKQEIQAAKLAQQQAFMEAQAQAQAQPLTIEKHGGAPCYECGGGHMEDGGAMTPDLEGQYPVFGYGGYDYDYGGPSPFNYGQFPAMKPGGDPDMAALWLAQQQFALQKRTGKNFPSDAKPTGTNPLNFNPYLKGSDIAEIDSMHTNPYDPRIAAYFKGSKVIAGPAENTGPAIQAARNINRGKMFKKDDEIYPNYFAKKTGGDTTKQGANQDYINQRNNQYTGFIQNNVLKNMHEEESEKVQNAYMQMEQGMHQRPDGSMMPNDMMQVGGGPGMSYGYNSYGAPNMNNQYKQAMYQAKINNYKDQHTQDSSNFWDANLMLASNIDQNLGIRGAFDNALDQLGTAQKGGTAQEQADWDAAWAQGESEEAKRTAIRKAEQERRLYDYTEGLRRSSTNPRQTSGSTYDYQNLPWFKQLAMEFGPQSRTNGMNYFPANLSQYYKMNKAGKEAFVNLPENFKTKGVEITRTKGPLGRTWLGKKMGVGARKINIKLTGESDWANSPYEQGPQVRLSDPTNPLHNPNQEDIQVMLDPSRNNNFGPEITTTPNPNVSWEFNKKAYGGGYYAQEGRFVVPQNTISFGKKIALNEAPKTQYATSFVGRDQPIDYKGRANIKDPEINRFEMADERGTDQIAAEADITPQWQGWQQTLGQYAVPGLNMLAKKFEQRDLRAAEKKFQEGMLADNSMISRPASAFDMGTYNINSGDFRENQKVPVQYPGYAQWGGFNTMQMGGDFEEGEELDLSPEEIENLRAQGYDVEFLD